MLKVLSIQYGSDVVSFAGDVTREEELFVTCNCGGGGGGGGSC